MAAWIKDLKFALRTLRKSPTLTLFALLTLALGIGANTAIFSVTRGVLLAPLPYPDASSIVRVWAEWPTSAEFYLHFRQRSSAFAALSMYRGETFSLSGDGRPEEIHGVAVTSGHFGVTGVRPALGRAFAPEETRPGQGQVALLSHGLWQRRFGGDPAAVGRSVNLNGSEHTVVGVMPESYLPVDERAQLWVPIAIDATNEMHWDRFGYAMIGRLVPGAALVRATGDLRAAVVAYEEVRPGYLTAHREATVVPWHEHLVGGVRATFIVLFGAVGLVLLIACANVASLLLVRITGRRRELALRSVLGAGRRRLAAQVLTECTLLSLAGGALGILAGSWTLAALVAHLPSSVPRVSEIRIDGPVMLFTLALAVVSGLIFGLLPALRAGRVDQRSVLASGARGMTVSSQRPYHLLIAAEIALAVVLVVGAGLLVKSFRELQAVDAGFVTERVLTLGLKPAPGAYSGDAERRGYFERVAERAAAVPGVTAAALINRLPMTPGDVSFSFHVPGQELLTDSSSVSVRAMSPELPATLGIPLLHGRPLTAADHPEAAQVGLINQALARRLWGDEAAAVGKQLYFEPDEPWFRVVGVVADIRQRRLDQDTVPQVYRPLAQASWATRMALVVRVAAGAPAVLPALEEALWSVDPQVPITGVATMDELIHRSMASPRLLTALFSLFGAVALVLGGLGVFGVTWYSVAQRTREHGIRMALGATGSDVVGTTLVRALRPVAAGLAVGGLASLGLTQLLGSFLFRVAPTDPMVFGTVFVLLAACAALAAWLPARRATKVDPMIALSAD